MKMDPKPKILIVDDESDTRDFIAKILEPHHYEVLTAPSGEDALILLENSNQIDIILLDVMMPGLDGFEVMEILHHNPETKHIKIIMLTALDDEQVVVKAFAAGVADFLGKPFTKGELVARIETQVRLKRTEDALTQRNHENIELYQQAQQEILERKNVEESLRESETRYRILAENASDLITKLTPDGVYTYVSPACRTILGYEPTDLRGHSFYEFIHSEDLANIKFMNPPLLSPTDNKVFTLRFRHKNDTYVWLESSLRGVYHSETGALRRLVIIARDVTERLDYENALQRAYDELEQRVQDRTAALTKSNDLLKQQIIEREQAERRYRELFEEAPTMYVITRTQESLPIIADCNELFLNTLKYTRQDVIERPLTDFYTPESKKGLLESGGYQQALNGNLTAIEHALLAGDGRVINTLLRAKPDVDANGNIVGTQAMYIDITKRKQVELENAHLFKQAQQEIIERKQVEATLEKERATLARRIEERTAELSAANAELARAARLKDEFLASMSHELRTPLNAILGMSEGLLEEVGGPITDKQRKSLHSIEESGRHLLSLINDILDVSKIEAGKMQLEIEPVSAKTICQASLRLIKQSAYEKQLKVSSHFDSSVDTIQADERRLKQILVNMLSNAVKFTPENGKIGLEMVGNAEEQVIHFTVWDTGIGISPEQLPKLFKPFIQLDSRLSRHYSGTGLGLVLIQRMAEMHGGSVSIESQVGQGSRFTVSLPWHIEQSNKPFFGSTLNPEYQLKNSNLNIHRVLIIEDSSIVADQYRRYLNEFGVKEVVHLCTVTSLKEIVEFDPDVIILDIFLPDIPGWHILTQLKAETQTQNIPVIIASVIDERSRGLALGAAEYLVKPISGDQLQQVLVKVLPASTSTPGQIKTKITTPVVSSPYQGEAPLILLAEDSEANINTIHDYLLNKGYRLIVARNGLEAITRAQEEIPDMILMDIQMPEMDGLEAIRRIRSNNQLAHTSIIALTALAMSGDREKCLAAGANAYISKPISLKGLITAIGALLNENEAKGFQK